MAINWGMAGQNNNALAYFQMGQQLGQQVIDKRINSAAARFMQGDQNAIADVAKYDAGLGMQLQERAARQKAMAEEQAAKQREQLRQSAIQQAQLLGNVTDESSFQQARQVAAQLQMDVSKIPVTYNPQWVEEQKLITRFVAEKPEALSTFGKIAADKGLQPGTPEFAADVAAQVKADAFKTVPMVPGGGVAGINTQTGQAQVLIKPDGYGATTGGGVQEGATATNPQTGAKIIFRNGQWQPMGGQPAGGVPFAQ